MTLSLRHSVIAAAFVCVTEARAACPDWMPTRTSTAACSAVKACLAQQEAQPKPAIVGGTPDLVLARQAYACAVSAETRAIGGVVAVATLAPVAPCPAIASCEPCPVCGVSFVEGLAGFGLCAGCSAIAAGAARATCP